MRCTDEKARGYKSLRGTGLINPLLKPPTVKFNAPYGSLRLLAVDHKGNNPQSPATQSAQISTTTNFKNTESTKLSYFVTFYYQRIKSLTTGT